MAGIKTHITNDDAVAFLGKIPNEARREDCLALVKLMSDATGEEPALWTSGMIGFGTFHYRSPSGSEGDWFPVGFASRKAAISVYLGLSLDDLSDLMEDLGKYTTGKGCVYIKRLSDVDLSVLKKLVSVSYTNIKKTYG